MHASDDGVACSHVALGVTVVRGFVVSSPMKSIRSIVSQFYFSVFRYSCLAVVIR